MHKALGLVHNCIVTQALHLGFRAGLQFASVFQYGEAGNVFFGTYILRLPNFDALHITVAALYGLSAS